MAPVDDYCKVTAHGVAHLFLGLDYGSVCVCGRKVFVFAVEDEQPILRDRPQDETASLLVAAVRRQTPPTPRLVRLDLLMAHGEAQIHRARLTREGIQAARVTRSFLKTERLLARGAYLLGSARRVCNDSALARARRDSASGRRRPFAHGATPDLHQGLRPDPAAALMKA
jgi:hypothetical protein